MKLDEIKYNLDNEIGDYYETIVLYINELIKSDKKDQAFELLKEELSQPYIPQKTLEKLEEIFETQYASKVISIKELTIDEASFSLRKLDVKNILVGFSKLNLRLIIDDVKFFIETSDDFLSVSFLLFMLVEQQISVELSISKFGYVKQCNPVNLEHIDEDIIEKYAVLFEKHFEKDIVYSKYCMEILKFYLMITYPLKMDMNYDLFDEIVNYVLKVVGENSSDNSLEFLEIIEYDKG